MLFPPDMKKKKAVRKRADPRFGRGGGPGPRYPGGRPDGIPGRAPGKGWTGWPDCSAGGRGERGDGWGCGWLPMSSAGAAGMCEVGVESAMMVTSPPSLRWKVKCELEERKGDNRQQQTIGNVVFRFVLCSTLDSRHTSIETILASLSLHGSRMSEHHLHVVGRTYSCTIPTTRARTHHWWAMQSDRFSEVPSNHPPGAVPRLCTTLQKHIKTPRHTSQTLLLVCFTFIANKRFPVSD